MAAHRPKSGRRRSRNWIGAARPMGVRRPVSLMIGAAFVAAIFLGACSPAREPYTLGEYREWCSAQSLEVMESMIYADSWGDVGRTLDAIADQAERTPPPASLETEHDEFIRAVREAARPSFFVRLALNVMLSLTSLILDITDAVVSWTGSESDLAVREHLMGQFVSAGLDEANTQAVLGGYCNVNILN